MKCKLSTQETTQVLEESWQAKPEDGSTSKTLKHMRVEILSFMYNEEFLLPFFLNHYSWADKINVIYDVDSTDKTLKMLRADPKVNVIPFHFPDMMDDVLKAQKISQIYKTLPKNTCVFIVDADEFIFTNRNEIENLTHPIINVKLFDVYRHKSESDLDVNKPVVTLRRHGVFVEGYNKPIIVKTGLDIEWCVGNHAVMRPKLSSKNIFQRVQNILLNQHHPTSYNCNIVGAHWANADPCFCVERRVKNRRDRQSQHNLTHGLTVQHQNITEENVLAESKRHDKDPEVFGATSVLKECPLCKGAKTVKIV